MSFSVALWCALGIVERYSVEPWSPTRPRFARDGLKINPLASGFRRAAARSVSTIGVRAGLSVAANDRDARAGRIRARAPVGYTRLHAARELRG